MGELDQPVLALRRIVIEVRQVVTHRPFAAILPEESVAARLLPRNRQEANATSGVT
jgi:hypothetical protein